MTPTPGNNSTIHPMRRGPGSCSAPIRRVRPRPRPAAHPEAMALPSPAARRAGAPTRILGSH